MATPSPIHDEFRACVVGAVHAYGISYLHTFTFVVNYFETLDVLVFDCFQQLRGAPFTLSLSFCVFSFHHACYEIWHDYVWQLICDMMASVLVSMWRVACAVTANATYSRRFAARRGVHLSLGCAGGWTFKAAGQGSATAPVPTTC